VSTRISTTVTARSLNCYRTSQTIEVKSVDVRRMSTKRQSHYITTFYRKTRNICNLILRSRTTCYFIPLRYFTGVDLVRAFTTFEVVVLLTLSYIKILCSTYVKIRSWTIIREKESNLTWCKIICRSSSRKVVAERNHK